MAEEMKPLKRLPVEQDAVAPWCP